MRIDAAPSLPFAAVSALRAEHEGDEPSSIFPWFYSAEAPAMMVRGRRSREFRDRGGALPSRPRSKSDLMVQLFLASGAREFRVTICPNSEPTPKAENTLKTKGRERAFLASQS